MLLNPAYETIRINETYLLVDKENDVYFKIDKSTFEIIDSCDNISADQDSERVKYLVSIGILAADNMGHSFKKPKRPRGMFSITRIKIFSFRMEHILDRLIRSLHLAGDINWNRVFLSMGIIGICLSLLCVLYTTSVISTGSRVLTNDVVFQALPYTYIAVFLITCVHELGHAVICKLHCGYVGKCGLILFFFMPALFTNTTVSKFVSKDERIQIICAGIVSQLFVSALLSILLQIGSEWNILVWTILYFAFWINLIYILSNLNPLFKYDGYWLLSLKWDVEYLYEKAIVEVKNTFFSNKSKKKCDKKLLLYGIAIILFYCSMWAGSMVIIYSTLFPFIGFACIPIIAVVLFMIIQEVYKWSKVKI